MIWNWNALNISKDLCIYPMYLLEINQHFGTSVNQSELITQNFQVLARLCSQFNIIEL